MPSPQRSSNGRGWCASQSAGVASSRPAVSRLSTACAGALGTMSPLTELAKQLETTTTDAKEQEDESLEDDRLRLIFTCCHPPCRLRRKWL